MIFAKLLSNLLLLLLIVHVALHGQQSCFVAAEDSSTDGTAASGADEEPELKLDPSVIRDAIASVLRSGAKVSEAGSDGNDDDGYAEAAQEYLEHVQTVLASAATPIEVYIREQVADLQTLSQLLNQLSRRNLTKTSTLRLAARLLKGPAKELILPTLTNQNAASAGTAELGTEFSYSNSKAAQLVANALNELTKFLSEEGGEQHRDSDSSMTDRLKRYGETLGSEGPIREYLDGVLDRMLELEGKKVRFNVEFPEAKGDEANSLGEARVSRLPDDDDERNDSDSSSTSTAEAQDGGRSLFDQVLCRRAAESLADALADENGEDDASDSSAAGSASARLRIQELRGRQYQPAGLEAMLEAIEDCL